VITERKRAEQALKESLQRLKFHVENSPLAVVEFNKDFQIIHWSNKAERVFGWNSEEVLGKRVDQLRWVHEDDEQRVAALMADMLASRRTSNIHTNRNYRKDGSVITCEWYNSAMVDATGNLVSVLSLVLDITERKRMEEELLRAQKLESVGILAGGIAHDFNNILTTILGNVSLAKNHVTSDDEIFDLLNEAETASARAQSLTRQLLTFAKGGVPVKETASIKDILKESSSFVLRGSKSGCEFSIAEDLWAAEVDIGQISQVINNIVINANQAMPKGGIIQVAAENQIIEDRHGLPVKPGRYIRISVIDQGAGIAEDHLLNIFDPYFSTKQEGSGLGLATTYSIIKKHDGHITVESRLGVGTTFHIYLPASEKAVPEKEEVTLIKGRGRILVMDDQAPLRKMLGRMLEMLGYESEAAKDGAEAIRMFKGAKESEKPYDAVILDLTVPGGMGGKETINKLLEIDPEVKAIVSSGYSDDPVLSNFQEYGFKGIIPKPFESRSLGKVLHEVLKGEKLNIED
jgi:PAS domain S-box-containing protein